MKGATEGSCSYTDWGRSWMLFYSGDCILSQVVRVISSDASNIVEKKKRGRLSAGLIGNIQFYYLEWRLAKIIQERKMQIKNGTCLLTDASTTSALFESKMTGSCYLTFVGVWASPLAIAYNHICSQPASGFCLFPLF